MIEFYRTDYLKRNTVDEYTYDLLLMCEYLRRKNVPNTETMPLKKLFAFHYLHKELDNREMYDQFDIGFAQYAAFKLKNGEKIIKKVLRKLMG